jgi:single-stranded-DNA-specific exonuclease
MEKRWTIVASDAVKTEALQAALSINKTICSILVSRGIETFEIAKDFYRPQLSDLHDPWLMKDMDKAVTRILRCGWNHCCCKYVSVYWWHS